MAPIRSSLDPFEPVDFRLVPDDRGLPMLLIDFAGGHTAAIWRGMQKLDLVRMGLVFLGDEFEDLVPPIVMAATEEYYEATITGFTQNPVIAAAVQQFLGVSPE